MNDKLKPALIGGVVLGLLSVIPFVNFVNLCCCLWAIVGGALATQMYVKSSPVPASAGDGAILGVLAGLVGGAINIIIGIPVNLVVGAAMRGVMLSFLESMNPGQVDMMRAQMEASASVAGTIVNQLIGSVLLIVFATIGGLIGIPIFEKRKGNMTPPPPPNTGGAGGYAA
jgi:hypothetical protein